jgi:hypothetical protein
MAAKKRSSKPKASKTSKTKTKKKKKPNLLHPQKVKFTTVFQGNNGLTSQGAGMISNQLDLQTAFNGFPAGLALADKINFAKNGLIFVAAGLIEGNTSKVKIKEIAHVTFDSTGGPKLTEVLYLPATMTGPLLPIANYPMHIVKVKPFGGAISFDTL